MAKRRKTPPTPSAEPGKPAGRQPTPGIIHTSVYLPSAAHEALRVAAFNERLRIHDIIMLGIEMALRKRGYPSMAELKAQSERKGPLERPPNSRPVRRRTSSPSGSLAGKLPVLGQITRSYRQALMSHTPAPHDPRWSVFAND
jgi:hypothetical protein